MPEAGRAKIVFRLPKDNDGYPPCDSESLWAKELSGGLYEIDNIPFFVKSIAVGDKVRTTRLPNGELHFDAAVQFSGHSTLRVVVYEESHVAALRSELAALGCSSEVSHIPRLVAVDVPAAISLEVVRKLLEGGTRAGKWEVEEACIGHQDS